MQGLIEVFRMSEVSIKVRCELLIKLGEAINMQYGGNYTEPLVLELVRTLDSNHTLCNDPHYLLSAKEISLDEYKLRKGIRP